MACAPRESVPSDSTSAKRAAREENDHENVRARHESSRHGEHRTHRADRRRLDVVVRSGDDKAAPGDGVIASLELTGGEHPRERGGEDDTAEEKNDGVRQTRHGHGA
jgi:hypothetical protein